MKKIIISTLAVSALLMNTACNTDFDQDVKNIKVTNGSADFSNYVALGNSLTSGYRDGALYQDGQLESYPNMIAEQMKLAGGGDFTQPLMQDNIGGFADLIKIPGLEDKFRGKFELSIENGSLAPTRLAPKTNLDRLTGSYNNMGVPGAKSFHLVTPEYGNQANLGKSANPYFVRFASSPNASVLSDAIAKKPTFFSLWIGNNDVLSYATSGGVGKNQTGNINPRTYTENDITDPQVFAGSIKAILDGMKSAGATKGVIANIPNVVDIPFFTTVPSKPISEITDAQALALNTAYAEYNAALQKVKSLGLINEEEYKQRLISFKVKENNGAVIVDKDLTDLSAYGVPSYRQTTNKDYILLSVSTHLKNGGGTQTALTDAQVLTEKEVENVLTATKAYNSSIKTLADTYGLAFVDANAKMVELSKASGIQWDGVKYNARFVTGGAFSLDGVHLTGRGYGIIANEFIKAINEKYGSTLPQVNPNKYSGIKFP